MTPERQADLSIQDAQAELQVSPSLMNALLVSGLLGYWENGRVPRIGIEHFKLYGTQWRKELGERQQSLLHFQGKDHAMSTRMWIKVTPSQAARAEPDIASLAQFYVRPNPFFFLDPAALAPVGPLGLKLERYRIIEGVAKHTVIFPDPEGYLAMAAVFVDAAGDDAFRIAYDVVSPLLDELSFHHDQPLPVVQTVVVGIPSGTLSVSYSKRSERQAISPTAPLLPRYPFPSLEHAGSLYREGISSNNPFHQFLALWRCYENAVQVRGDWHVTEQRNRTDRRGDVETVPESFPDTYAFGGFVGLKVGVAMERMWHPYRCVLAHGDTQDKSGGPKTGATAADYIDVMHHVPIIRHMARVTLLNVRATLGSNLKPA